MTTYDLVYCDGQELIEAFNQLAQQEGLALRKPRGKAGKPAAKATPEQTTEKQIIAQVAKALTTDGSPTPKKLSQGLTPEQAYLKAFAKERVQQKNALHKLLHPTKTTKVTKTGDKWSRLTTDERKVAAQAEALLKADRAKILQAKKEATALTKANNRPRRELLANRKRASAIMNRALERARHAAMTGETTLPQKTHKGLSTKAIIDHYTSPAEKKALARALQQIDFVGTKKRLTATVRVNSKATTPLNQRFTKSQNTQLAAYRAKKETDNYLARLTTQLDTLLDPKAAKPKGNFKAERAQMLSKKYGFNAVEIDAALSAVKQAQQRRKLAAQATPGERFDKKVAAYLKSSTAPRRLTVTTIKRRIEEHYASGQPLTKETLQYVFRQSMFPELWTPDAQAHMGTLFTKYINAKTPAERNRLRSQIAVQVGRRQRLSLSRTGMDIAKAGWLLTPSVQISNAKAQYLWALFQKTTDLVRVATDVVASKATKLPREYHLPGNVSPEIKALVNQHLPTQLEELKNILNDFIHGGDSRATSGDNDFVQRAGVQNSPYLGIPFRAVGVVSGLIDRPVALNFARERFAHRLQGLANSGAELTPDTITEAFAQSLLEGQTVVFQNKSPMAAAQLSVRDSIRKMNKIKALRPAAALLELTFTKFPNMAGNLTQAAIDHSVAKIFIEIASRGNRTPEESKRRFVNAFSQILTGSAFSGLFIAASAGGAIIVEYSLDDSHQLKAANRQQGNIRYSLNLSAMARAILSGRPLSPGAYDRRDNDFLYSFESEAPLKQQIVLAHLLVKGSVDGTPLAENLQRALMSSMLSDDIKSGLPQQIARIMNHHNKQTGESDPLGGLTSELGKSAGAMVTAPGLPALAKLGDPYVRDTSGSDFSTSAAKTIAGNVPGVRGMMPVTLDPWGDPVKYNSPQWTGIRSARLQGPNDDIVKHEATRLANLGVKGVLPAEIANRKGLVDETGKKIDDEMGNQLREAIPEDLRREAIKLQGDLQHRAYTPAIRSAFYQTASDKVKGELLARINRDVAQATNIKLFGAVPNVTGRTPPGGFVLLTQPGRYQGEYLSKYYQAFRMQKGTDAEKAGKKQASAAIIRSTIRPLTFNK